MAGESGGAALMTMETNPRGWPISELAKLPVSDVARWFIVNGRPSSPQSSNPARSPRPGTPRQSTGDVQRSRTSRVRSSRAPKMSKQRIVRGVRRLSHPVGGDSASAFQC